MSENFFGLSCWVVIFFVHASSYKTRKMFLGNDFFGDNCLIVSVVSVGDSLSIYGFQKLCIEAVTNMGNNCSFWAFCNTLIRHSDT